MTGLTPVPFAALKSCTAPAIEPWSVSETAGISSSAARATRSGIRHAPSRIEYSEWTCRWTKGAVAHRLGQSRAAPDRSRSRLSKSRPLRAAGSRKAADSPRIRRHRSDRRVWRHRRTPVRLPARRGGRSSVRAPVARAEARSRARRAARTPHGACSASSARRGGARRHEPTCFEARARRTSSSARLATRHAGVDAHARALPAAGLRQAARATARAQIVRASSSAVAIVAVGERDGDEAQAGVGRRPTNRARAQAPFASAAQPSPGRNGGSAVTASPARARLRSRSRASDPRPRAEPGPPGSGGARRGGGQSARWGAGCPTRRAGVRAATTPRRASPGTTRRPSRRAPPRVRRSDVRSEALGIACLDGSRAGAPLLCQLCDNSSTAVRNGRYPMRYRASVTPESCSADATPRHGLTQRQLAAARPHLAGCDLAASSATSSRRRSRTLASWLDLMGEELDARRRARSTTDTTRH